MASIVATKFHLTCGQSKKIVSCTASELKQKVSDTFSLSDGDYFLQVWDTEFHDWIDVDDFSVVEAQQTCKLQIIVK
jgi:hypothetical protein